MDERVLNAIEALLHLSSCRCHPGFKDRGLHDPNCDCDYKEDVDVVVNYINQLTEMKKVVEWIASDYVELSHDKVRWQRDEYIKKCKEVAQKHLEDGVDND